MQQFIDNPQIIALLIWSFFWKGWALWRASKNNQKYWFIIILVVNTLAILEIIYLVFFQEKDRWWEKILKKLNKKSSK